MNEWLLRENGAGAVGANEVALDCVTEDRFIHADGANSIFTRQPIIAAVLRVAQAWVPLPSAIIVRALKKCAQGHDENVMANYVCCGANN